MSYIKDRITYPSADGKNTVAAYIFVPEGGEVRAVFQLCHGMCEYILRYEPFAAYLCAHGIAFAGNDHLGHGETAASADDLGYTVDAKYMVEDVRTLTGLLKERFGADTPFIFSGHSMGSFIARTYLARYGKDGIDAAIIIGTAGPGAPTGAGKAVARLIGAFRGDRYRSKLLKTMAFGSYTKRCPKGSSPSAWISRDDVLVARYDADPFCSYLFTVRGYIDLFTLLGGVSAKSWAGTIPKDLPILLTAGEEDPVGAYGKGVREVYQRLCDAGVKDVTLKLYPGDRHEILNEPDRETVYADMLAYVERQIERKKDK